MRMALLTAWPFYAILPRPCSRCTPRQDRADRAGAEEHEHFHTHSNIITSLYVKPGSETDFTTAGLDGRVVFWNVAGLEGSFAEMNLRSE